MPAVRVTPVYEPRVRGLCVKPYALHPKGCPNFDSKAGCPPGAPQLPAAFDLSRPCFAIYGVFDLAAHVERMRAAHPAWSDRQLTCCLYWQPAARKVLESEIAKFLVEHPEMEANRCPEALGMNVTATMAAAGVELEWPPRTKTVQVALAAVPLACVELRGQLGMFGVPGGAP
jgi:predicted metal-binding protein